MIRAKHAEETEKREIEPPDDPKGDLMCLGTAVKVTVFLGLWQ